MTSEMEFIMYIIIYLVSLTIELVIVYCILNKKINVLKDEMYIISRSVAERCNDISMIDELPDEEWFNNMDKDMKYLKKEVKKLKFQKKKKGNKNNEGVKNHDISSKNKI